MRYKYELYMLLATLLWGSAVVTGKVAMNLGITPNYYTGIRFTVATLVLCVIFRQALRRMDRATFLAGILVGLALGLGYILQTIGLSMTTASKTGFLTGLYIVLVPVFDCVLKRVWLQKSEIVGIVVATIGLALLSLNRDFSITTGDLVVLASTVSFAASVIMIDRFVSKSEPILLTIVQIGTTAVMGVVLGLVIEATPTAATFTLPIVGLVLYGAVFGSAVNTTLQNIAQTRIAPITASLILVLDPVFAALFGFIFLHDPIGIKELIGSAFILAGMLIILLMRKEK